MCGGAVVAGTSYWTADLALTIAADDEVAKIRGPSPPCKRRDGAPQAPGERIYTREEVSQMDGVDGRPMWVTYKDGVYDISAFHLEHPGGKIIKQAAGGDVSAFWDIWAYHHHAPKVGEYLKKLRIGTLRQEDRIENDYETSEDPYANEPVRDLEIQTVLTERPFCSETPSSVLVTTYLTSSDALYVRNHAPVPSCAWESEGESRNEAQDQHEIVFEASETNEDEHTLTVTVGELHSQFDTYTRLHPYCSVLVIVHRKISPQPVRPDSPIHPLKKSRTGWSVMRSGVAFVLPMFCQPCIQWSAQSHAKWTTRFGM